MVQWYVLSLFLYFPKDKREYIPAVISLAIFMIAAVITMRLIISYSKREEKKAKELEEKLKHDRSNWNS
jgi:flagellar biosynthesis/type III secretory pathway M-ring protein FliF/YscJ